MARHSKQQRGKGSASTESLSTKREKPAAEEPPGDPLHAFPADPPRKNLALLIVSAVLFAVWFCYLAIIALSG